MKNLLLALSLSLAIGTVITLNSCIKTPATNSSEDDSISAEDAASITSAINLTADDASASAGQVQSFTGKTNGLYQGLCGVSLVDSSNTHQIVITYLGTLGSCYGFTRSGNITITLTNGAAWRDTGAQLTIVYNNLVVTDLLSLSTFTLNGTHVITNELGGLAWQIAYGLVKNATTKHRDQSTNMVITFPNSSQRTWTVDRSRQWTSVATGSANLITVTDYTEAANNVDVTGTNRFGNTFTNSILSYVMSDNNTACYYLYLPYQGKIQHTVGSRTASITYGVNASGTQIGSATNCSPGFLINYENAANGASLTRYVCRTEN